MLEDECVVGGGEGKMTKTCQMRLDFRGGIREFMYTRYTIHKTATATNDNNMNFLWLLFYLRRTEFFPWHSQQNSIHGTVFLDAMKFLMEQAWKNIISIILFVLMSFWVFFPSIGKKIMKKYEA